MFKRIKKLGIIGVTCLIVLILGLTAFFCFFVNDEMRVSTNAAIQYTSEVIDGWTVSADWSSWKHYAAFKYDDEIIQKATCIITTKSQQYGDGSFKYWKVYESVELIPKQGYTWKSSRTTFNGENGNGSSLSAAEENLGKGSFIFDDGKVTATRNGNVFTFNKDFSGIGSGKYNIYDLVALDISLDDMVRTVFSINYNLNGGELNSTQLTEYIAGSNSQTLTVSTPTRTGYNFNGWTVSWTDSDYSGTLPSVSGTTLTIPANTSGNITLTANWSARSYNITYNLGGGSHGSTHPTTYTFSASRQTKTISNPTRVGYTFNSWTISRSSYGGSAPTISGTTLTIPASSYGNITLTANWSANIYYIVYNGNGATSGSMSNTTCRYGSTYTLTANAFVRTGYNFMGWATSENGAVAYGDRASVNNLTSTNGGEFNLYAVWEIQSFTVSVNINDTTKGSVLGTGTYHYGESVSLIAIPINALYHFVWWESLDGQMLSTSPTYTIDFLTADITLCAIFASNDAVTYATNGGETRIYNDGAYLHAKAIAYSGYIFLSWITNDGTDMAAYTSNEITIPSSNIAGKVLIAQFAVQGQTTPTTIFQSLEQEVTVNATVGGEVRISGYDLTDATLVHLSAVNYYGYRFIGWTANDDTDLSAYGISANIPLNIIKGKVITANFELINDNMTNPDTDNGYNSDFVF